METSEENIGIENVKEPQEVKVKKKLGVKKPPADLPESGSVLPRTPPIPGVPIGLEPFVGIDSIYIRQQRELLHLHTDIETDNHYDVYSNGQRIFVAGESTYWRNRYMGKHRPFELLIMNDRGQSSMKVEREYNCSLCFWGGNIAGSRVKVQSSYTDEVYGRVLQRSHWCCPTYDILNGADDKVMVLRSPSCKTCCSANYDVFRVTPEGEEKFGTILKSLVSQEMLVGSSNFGMEFPSDFDPTLKAVLLGAILCIDISYFEPHGASSCSVSPGYKSVICSIIILITIVVPIGYIMFLL
ncbi:unnamed protein product [Allacma fusca]|uniref:Phospholipid scramblase n=1 Tax=Allacma fusca TaxID=39272 RepID=A0A8J2PID5_9HEXA|nr:unnamed protein product [Allacma fusca]